MELTLKDYLELLTVTRRNMEASASVVEALAPHYSAYLMERYATAAILYEKVYRMVLRGGGSMKATVKKGVVNILKRHKVKYLCINIKTGKVYIPSLPADSHEWLLYYRGLPLGYYKTSEKLIHTVANEVLGMFDLKPVPF